MIGYCKIFERDFCSNTNNDKSQEKFSDLSKWKFFWHGWNQYFKDLENVKDMMKSCAF